jgi:hypothetical protein
MCCSHSRRILLRTWLLVFWASSTAMLGGLVVYESSRPEGIRDSPATPIFVASALLSMVYVRWWYYPWLTAKKNDGDGSESLATATAVTLADPPPLAISLV